VRVLLREFLAVTSHEHPFDISEETFSNSVPRNGRD